MKIIFCITGCVGIIVVSALVVGFGRYCVSNESTILSYAVVGFLCYACGLGAALSHATDRSEKKKPPVQPRASMNTAIECPRPPRRQWLDVNERTQTTL